jgi:type I site-specific restriction-modification system R (restriction) subunit
VPVELTEADVETLATDWFRSLGYDCALGSEISPDGARPLRESVSEVALTVPLRAVIARLNPKLPPEAVEDMLRQALRQPTPALVQNNFRFHKLLTDGVQVEYRRKDGKEVGEFARLVDFDDPKQNEFLVARQFTVRGDRGALRRADLSSSSTACRWLSSRSRTRPTNRPASGRRTTTCKSTRPTSRGCSRLTICWSSPTACRRGSAP